MHAEIILLIECIELEFGTCRIQVKYDYYGHLVSYKRNEKKIERETDQLGFFVIVTSQKLSASEALDIYRKRDSVEKIFRMLKTGLEYDTFRVHSQKSLESKTYVMFIASIVRNHMFQQFKQVALKEKDKKNYTVPAAIGELEKVTAVKTVREFISGDMDLQQNRKRF